MSVKPPAHRNDTEPPLVRAGSVRDGAALSNPSRTLPARDDGPWMLFGRFAILTMGIALAATMTAPHAAAYIHYPPMTLPKMCKHSHHIRVLKVAKFDKEKGVVVFENMESLTGSKSQITSFRHVLRPANEA